MIEIEKANNTIKKEFSFKRIVIRGLLQGLGIVVGSTILAGILYSITIKFIDKEIINKMTLEYVIEKENSKK